MKLTTKRNRWYFWRELFSFMIPMILIVGTIDVFYHFLQCPLHPEWSAPCNVNRILAIIYGIFLLITIVLEIISSKSLRNIKKEIEEDSLFSINSYKNKDEKILYNEGEANRFYDKNEGIIDMIEKNKHEEDDKFEEGIKSKQERTTKRKNFRKKSTNKNNQ